MNSLNSREAADSCDVRKVERRKVEVIAQRATGTMQSRNHTTLCTTEIVGSRTLKMHVLRLDERLQPYSNLIQFAVVFGETLLYEWLHDNESAWCVSTGGAGRNSSLYCRGRVTGTKEIRIRSGSILQTTIDYEKKTVQFAVDLESFAPIKMDVTDLQIRQLRAAVLISGEAQIEMSEE